MKLSELQERRRDASTAASNQVRTLALSGLAVVWLFTADFFKKKAAARPSEILAIAGAVFAAALLFDLFQLVLRAVSLWAVYHRRWKKLEGTDGADDAEILVGDWPNRLTTPPFFLKLAALLSGYVCLAIYFVHRY